MKDWALLDLPAAAAALDAISPQDAGGQQIGHLGFFRCRFADVLWPQFISWLLDATPVTLGERRKT